MRSFPLPLGANLPELDVPAWWILGRKATMYYDGRTDARSVRSNMQFLLGEKTLDEFKALEPTFRDIQAYLKSLKPPKYPFPIDPSTAARGQAVFAKNCAKCHGTYGPDGEYPSKIVDLDVIGTDPARALGISDRLVAHYNSTWFGEDYPVSETMIGYQAPPLDGIWATAPYLHNGSVPTLALLLKSSKRPPRFTRPPRPTSSTTTRSTSAGSSRPSPTVPSGLTAPQARYHLRHRPVRPGQRRPQLRRQAGRRRAVGRDRVSEDAVGEEERTPRAIPCDAEPDEAMMGWVSSHRSAVQEPRWRRRFRHSTG